MTGQAHAFVSEALARARVAGRQGVAVVVDDLEKLGHPEEDKELEVLRSAERVFAGQADAVRLPCHLVVAVPLGLSFLNPGLGGLYTGEVRPLPMVKVRERDGALCAAGMDRLLELVRRRTPSPDVVFGDPWQDRAGRLALASGGYVRDLLRMVRSVSATLSEDDVDPAPERLDAAVDRAIAELRNAYARLVRRNDFPLLEPIAKRHVLELQDDVHLGRAVGLFRRKVVLCYHNGGDWYDLQPLFREAAGLAADSEGA
jgi:hypothetical protein